MTRKLMTLALMLGLSTILSAKEPTRQLLRELDAALANASTYEGYFQQRTDVLRQMLAGKNTPEQEYEIRKKLASEFTAYSLDSTVVQLDRNRALARQLGDAYRQAETEFALAREYALAGYHSDALDILSGYRLEAIPPGLEYAFFEVCNYLYGVCTANSPPTRPTTPSIGRKRICTACRCFRSWRKEPMSGMTCSGSRRNPTGTGKRPWNTP